MDGEEIGVGKVLVEVGEIGAINACDGELPCPNRLLKEVGIDGLAHLDLHLASHRLRNHQFARADGVCELRHLALDHVAADKAAVVVLANALNGYATEVGVGLQHARLRAEACYGRHIRDGRESRRDGIVDDDGRELLLAKAPVVHHLDVRPKAQHLVLHFFLEAQHDSHADQHHSQANSNAHGSNARGETRGASAASALREKSFSYVPGEQFQLRVMS